MESQRSLANQVASKLEEGNFKGAVCLAYVDYMLADHSPATIDVVKKKS